MGSPLWSTATHASAQEPGGLELGEVAPEELVAAPAEGAGPSAALGWGAVVLLAGVVAAVALTGRRAPAHPPPLRLGGLGVPAKLAITGVLAAFLATHVVAAASVWLDTRVVYASTEEYFFYLKPARLTGLSHAHLMGISTMQGVAAGLYAPSRRDGPVTRGVVTLAFVAIVADIASWWLVKYAGPGFEALSMVAGFACSAAFAWMAGAVLRDVWWPRGAA
ncbi:MAG: hypothetical protein ACOZNI_12645 [Myxococcota bacterium]